MGEKDTGIRNPSDDLDINDHQDAQPSLDRLKQAVTGKLPALALAGTVLMASTSAMADNPFASAEDLKNHKVDPVIAALQVDFNAKETSDWESDAAFDAFMAAYGKQFNLPSDLTQWSDDEFDKAMFAFDDFKIAWIEKQIRIDTQKVLNEAISQAKRDLALNH